MAGNPGSQSASARKENRAWRLLANAVGAVSVVVIVISVFWPSTITDAVAQAREPFVVEGGTLSLGTIAPGVVAHGRFQIRNWRLQMVHILSTDTSCGCTVARCSTRSIAPWKTADVEVAVKPAESGVATKLVIIHTDHGAQYVQVHFDAEQPSAVSAVRHG